MSRSTSLGDRKSSVSDPFDVLAALHWCRIGGGQKPSPQGFQDAKRMGLLVQDPMWRTTEAGNGLLVALGALENGAQT